MHFPGFRPVAFRWLKDLEANNSKAWFEANRATYDEEIRAPLALLVEDVDARLGTIAPEMTGTPKRNIFRIHRDVRFSNDKRPYKTNVACRFFHRDAGARALGGDGASAAGFYFQLGHDESYAAAGLWAPPGAALAAIRRALDDDLEGFERAVSAPAFRRAAGELDEELMLKRLPRGVAPGHPAERWLRYKSFTVTRALGEDELLGPSLPDRLARYYQATLPLVRWLNAALGLRPSDRR